MAPHGELPVVELLEKFNYDSNEDYAAGRVSRAELFEQLATQFDQNEDKRISEREFIDFYTNLGTSFVADDQFSQFALNQWGLY